ncbi:MAG: hypothetical protein IPJ85_18395 [Flavobacteriales bacterium]|nr:hypothetical protein [Flavobacteriales bacterium]
MRFDCGKSCIRFRALTPELVQLFDRIIKYVGAGSPEQTQRFDHTSWRMPIRPLAIAKAVSGTRRGLRYLGAPSSQTTNRRARS